MASAGGCGGGAHLGGLEIALAMKGEPQISPLRYAPVEMTIQLLVDFGFSSHTGNATVHYKLNCHLDRSVPGFPATLHWKRPRVRLSVRKAA
jgi:hypothetical protein